jgi:Holliday junction resolvase RusA-like endonuclease
VGVSLLEPEAPEGGEVRAVLEWTVHGPPVPWQRAGQKRVGRKVIKYTEPETVAFQTAVRVGATVQLQTRKRMGEPSWPTDGLYGLTVIAYFEDRRRRDLDNMLKTVGDALNKITYDDDSQIDEEHVFRRIDKQKPRTVITLWLLDQE